MDLIVFTVVGTVVGIAVPFLIAGRERRQPFEALQSEATTTDSSNLYLKYESYNRYENQDYNKEM